MFVYITLFILVMAFAILVRNREFVQVNIASRREMAGRRSVGMRSGQQVCNIWAATAIFLLLTAVSACRIAVGNDYWVYRDNFKLIMQERHVSYELGFNLVVWVIQSLFGYDNYLPVFGFFSIVTCFFFVKAVYDQGEWFAGSIFLLMTGGYYYSSLNSVRYYFALAVALYAMKYVLRKQYGVFCLWIIFAAFFHKSILVVLPVYLLARWFGEKPNKYLIGAGTAVTVSLIVFRDLYRKIIFKFYPFYEGSVFDQVDFSVTNIAKCLGVLVLCLIFYKTAVKDNMQNRFYFILSLAGTALYTVGAFVPESSRIGYYFIAPQIFLIPGVLMRIPNKKWKVFWMIGTAVAFLGYFILFLRSAYSIDIRLLPYLNWIFN